MGFYVAYSRCNFSLRVQKAPLKSYQPDPSDFITAHKRTFSLSELMPLSSISFPTLLYAAGDAYDVSAPDCVHILMEGSSANPQFRPSL